MVFVQILSLLIFHLGELSNLHRCSMWIHEMHFLINSEAFYQDLIERWISLLLKTLHLVKLAHSFCMLKISISYIVKYIDKIISCSSLSCWDVMMFDRNRLATEKYASKVVILYVHIVLVSYL